MADISFCAREAMETLASMAGVELPDEGPRDTKALEQRGEVVVREALVEKLLGVRFTLVPYSRDPAPERLEHSGSTGPIETASAAGGER